MAKDHKVNDQIRVRQIRLIGAEGEQIGIIDTREAATMAREQNLDLVMVSPQAVPPVCKLLDYGRFRFEQQQNEKDTRKRARSQEVKAIKFRVKIDANDFKTKTNHVKRFLEEGHKVKVTIMFRGRERTHPELGERILHRVADTLAEVGQPESPPNMMGMDMNMIMIPKVVRKPLETSEHEAEQGAPVAADMLATGTVAADTASTTPAPAENAAAPEAANPEPVTPAPEPVSTTPANA